MQRRALIVGLGLAAAWPMLAYAQQQAMPVIGFATDFTVKLNERFLAGVRKGLAEYGYVEGQNFRFEFQEANFQNDLLPILIGRAESIARARALLNVVPPAASSAGSRARTLR